MTEIDRIIGQNIRKYRKQRCWTIQELVRHMENDNQTITESTLGAWERGERTISAHHLYYVSKALGCSISSLYSEGIDQESRMHVEGSSLPDNERDIVVHSFTRWEGDVHALISLMGLYMALAPEHRQEVAGMGLTMYRLAVKAGRVVDVPYQVPVHYIEKQWLRLVRED